MQHQGRVSHRDIRNKSFKSHYMQSSAMSQNIGFLSKFQKLYDPLYVLPISSKNVPVNIAWLGYPLFANLSLICTDIIEISNFLPGQQQHLQTLQIHIELHLT